MLSYRWYITSYLIESYRIISLSHMFVSYRIISNTSYVVLYYIILYYIILYYIILYYIILYYIILYYGTTDLYAVRRWPKRRRAAHDCSDMGKCSRESFSHFRHDHHRSLIDCSGVENESWRWEADGWLIDFWLKFIYFDQYFLHTEVLRRRSAAARWLGLRVRIPPCAWMLCVVS